MARNNRQHKKLHSGAHTQMGFEVWFDVAEPFGTPKVEEMMDDLTAAIMLDSQQPLTGEQRHLCSSAATREFFQAGVREDSTAYFARCRAIGASRAARDALVAMARGMLWVVRNDAHRLGLARAIGLSVALMGLAVIRWAGVR